MWKKSVLDKEKSNLHSMPTSQMHAKSIPSYDTLGEISVNAVGRALKWIKENCSNQVVEGGNLNRTRMFCGSLDSHANINEPEVTIKEDR